MSQFSAIETSLPDIDARQAGALIAAAADIAVVVGAKGEVVDVAVDGKNPLGASGTVSAGRPWIDTVTRESRPKIEEIERDVTTGRATDWRQVNHPVAGGADVPVLYRAIRLEAGGNVIWLGRDLSGVSAIQQQLIAAQRKLEQEYARQRHLETRYRLLFQTVSDPIFSIDGRSLAVLEMNEAAAHALGDKSARSLGRAATELIDPSSVQAFRDLLDAARAAGRPREATLRRKGTGKDLVLSCRYLHIEPAPLFQVKILDVPAARSAAPSKEDLFREIAATAPDGVVATGLDGRILHANAAFLELAQLPGSERARGQPIETWLGQPGIDLNVLISNLRDYGRVQHFLSQIRGELGVTTRVEIAAVWIPHGGDPYLGFVIRNVDRRLDAPQNPPQDPVGSLRKIRELIGQASLKEIVRETADEIERLCIEAALELTGDNRASAAEMLGLSRQGLYVKLRRYGIGERDA